MRTSCVAIVSVWLLAGTALGQSGGCPSTEVEDFLWQLEEVITGETDGAVPQFPDLSNCRSQLTPAFAGREHLDDVRKSSALKDVEQSRLGVFPSLIGRMAREASESAAGLRALAEGLDRIRTELARPNRSGEPRHKNDLRRFSEAVARELEEKGLLTRPNLPGGDDLMQELIAQLRARAEPIGAGESESERNVVEEESNRRQPPATPLPGGDVVPARLCERHQIEDYLRSLERYVDDAKQGGRQASQPGVTELAACVTSAELEERLGGAYAGAIVSLVEGVHDHPKGKEALAFGLDQIQTRLLANQRENLASLVAGVQVGLEESYLDLAATLDANADAPFDPLIEELRRKRVGAYVTAMIVLMLTASAGAFALWWRQRQAREDAENEKSATGPRKRAPGAATAGTVGASSVPPAKGLGSLPEFKVQSRRTGSGKRDEPSTEISDKREESTAQASPTPADTFGSEAIENLAIDIAKVADESTRSIEELTGRFDGHGKRIRALEESAVTLGGPAGNASIAESAAEAESMAEARYAGLTGEIGVLRNQIAEVRSLVEGLPREPASPPPVGPEVVAEGLLATERELLSKSWRRLQQLSPDEARAIQTLAENDDLGLVRRLLEELPKSVKGVPELEALSQRVLQPVRELIARRARLSRIPKLTRPPSEGLAAGDVYRELAKVRDAAGLVAAVSEGELGVGFDESWLSGDFVTLADAFLCHHQLAHLESRQEPLEGAHELVLEALEAGRLEPIPIRLGETLFNSSEHEMHNTHSDLDKPNNSILRVVRNGFKNLDTGAVERPKVIVNRKEA